MVRAVFYTAAFVLLIYGVWLGSQYAYARAGFVLDLALFNLFLAVADD